MKDRKLVAVCLETEMRLPLFTMFLFRAAFIFGVLVRHKVFTCTTLTICFALAQKIKDPLHCAGFYLPLMPDVADDSARQSRSFSLFHVLKSQPTHEESQGRRSLVDLHTP